MGGLILYGESALRGDDLPLPTPGWYARARCAGEDTDDWYPEQGDGPDVVARAKAVCADCPARLPCLAWAIEHAEPGVWGGTTDRDRDYIRRGEPVPEPKPARTSPVAPGRPRRAPAPCGTSAAYNRHRRHGEDACDACREANTAKGRARRERAA